MNLHKLPQAEQAETLELLEELTKRRKAAEAKDSLLGFSKLVAPILQIETEPKEFMVGPHHRRIAQLFEAVARGEKKRVLISIAPRFGKSLLSSYLFPAWYLGKFPNRNVIMASHTADLASAFGRKIRDLIATPEYNTVFSDVSLKADSKAAGQWATNKGGQFYAVGVGGALAGRGAELLIIDDPFSEQSAVSGNADVFDDAWTWFQSGPLQRLSPSGAVVVIHCMVGDTQVLLPDGSSKNLRDIKVGDEIATYDKGKTTKAKVLNWANHGCDRVLAIRMKSGIIVRANRRHPFLVQCGSNTVWTRVQNLKVGEHILRVNPGVTKACSVPWMGVENRPDLGACASNTTTRLDGRQERGPLPTRPHQPPQKSSQQASGASTKGCSVLWRGVICQLLRKGCAKVTTLKQGGQRANDRHHTTQGINALGTSSTGMELLWSNTTPCFPHKTAAAPFVVAPQAQRPASTGIIIFVSTTVTQLRKFAAYCVMTATSLLGMGKPKQSCSPQPNTYEIIPDEIVSITEDGIEDVFDIQVEGTENFIANGLISHNTRWSKVDLIGRLINQMAKNPDAEQWDVVEFPAILGEDTPEAKSLWPERWPLETLLQKKAAIDNNYLWSAQYQQNPTGEAGALIKMGWWKNWEKDDPPDCEYLIMGLDAAQEAHTRADFNAWGVWGVWYDDNARANLILLDSWKKRLEYPDLKKAITQEYERWQPDCFVIEKKSNGSVLFQEFRAAGVPVSEFTPGKGQDKIARVNSVTEMFQSGLIWAPLDRRWAREVAEECNDFPNGANDDLVDMTTLCLRRFRTGGFIRLPSDEPDEDEMRLRKRRYY